MKKGCVRDNYIKNKGLQHYYSVITLVLKGLFCSYFADIFDRVKRVSMVKNTNEP